MHLKHPTHKDPTQTPTLSAAGLCVCVSGWVLAQGRVLGVSA
eukprot:CAMPEP_0173223800 /NCGR_PEP_ID=MMETSP1142-20121109/3986_1 /TAXON_ID=483371 /ORGANISM="non described non described, Strain CCMP2298" /LENGTH=41 /DNA_ID= /DNA_START= /DNA_END= /DNA_ORIENTATION=